MFWALHSRSPYSKFFQIQILSGLTESRRPWIDAMGGQATTIIMAVICLVTNLSFLAMVKWGKKFRARTARSYLLMTQQRARSVE